MMCPDDKVNKPVHAGPALGYVTPCARLTDLYEVVPIKVQSIHAFGWQLTKQSLPSMPVASCRTAKILSCFQSSVENLLGLLPVQLSNWQSDKTDCVSTDRGQDFFVIFFSFPMTLCHLFKIFFCLNLLPSFFKIFHSGFLVIISVCVIS